MGWPKGVSRADMPKRPRRNVAMAIDWQGDGDDRLTFVFAGADVDMLRKVFEPLCASANGIATGFRIESQQSIRWRQGHVNDRLALILEGRREQMMEPDALMVVVRQLLLRQANGGYVDCYELDDLLNLSGRTPSLILKIDDNGCIKRKRRRQKAQDDDPAKDQKTNHKNMANIYLRVPWYVAAYYRGRDENRQLTEWDAVEFADYSHEYMVLENNLRLMPVTLQSQNCFSQRSWQNMLKGRKPDGSDIIVRRDPKQWLSPQEVCTLMGVACNVKQAGSDFLCIRMPREVYFNKHVHRTTPDYCLSYHIGVYLASMLTRKFCYEYMEWCEYDNEYARRQGVSRKTIETVERFFTQFNFPVAILPTERETLRRLHTRWTFNAKKRPAYHYKFSDTSFLEHISDDDRQRAEERKKKKK